MTIRGGRTTVYRQSVHSDSARSGRQESHPAGVGRADDPPTSSLTFMLRRVLLDTQHVVQVGRVVQLPTRVEQARHGGTRLVSPINETHKTQNTSCCHLAGSRSDFPPRGACWVWLKLVSRVFHVLTFAVDVKPASLMILQQRFSFLSRV